MIRQHRTEPTPPQGPELPLTPEQAEQAIEAAQTRLEAAQATLKETKAREAERLENEKTATARIKPLLESANAAGERFDETKIELEETITALVTKLQGYRLAAELSVRELEVQCNHLLPNAHWLQLPAERRVLVERMTGLEQRFTGIVDVEQMRTPNLEMIAQEAIKTVGAFTNDANPGLVPDDARAALERAGVLEAPAIETNTPARKSTK
jgi:hypothetical protein